MPSDLSASSTLTAINKTFASNLDPGKRAIEAGDQVRIQFFQANGIQEQPSAVLGDLKITFKIATADLADTTLDKVYARVGGAAQTTSVAITNNGEFRAKDVAALNPTDATGPTQYVFSRSDPIPDPWSEIAAGAFVSTDYNLKIGEFAQYTNATAKVAIAKGDTPAAP